MKKLLEIILVGCLLTAIFSACSGNSNSSALGPGDILDTDSGAVYSLGDSKEIFDNAFAYLGTEESDGSNGLEVEYLSGILTVTYQDSKAVAIECDGGTSRFKFFNFTFDTDISDIKGRYNESKVSGYYFYSRYYDENGKDVDLKDSVYSHSLMVRDGDLFNMKDGQYLHYTISVK